MSRPSWIRVTVACVAVLASLAQAQSERPFSVPLQDLKRWSAHVTVEVDAKITGHSKVHDEAKDCEMHLGAQVKGYRGKPEGWVVEPMNLCLESMPQKGIETRKDWESLGDSLKGASVRLDGVVRLWPEHLEANPKDIDSNPAHATELHPLTKITRSGGSKLDFSSFIYPPGKLVGVKAKTAAAMLEETVVQVKEHDGTVDIDFKSIPFIGNFAQVDLSITPSTITEIEGSYAMEGFASADGKPPKAVRLVTVAGSQVNHAISKIKKNREKAVDFEALVLFSLNPVTLYEAAAKSDGNAIEVSTPIQLIIYGPIDTE